MESCAAKIGHSFLQLQFFACLGAGFYAISHSGAAVSGRFIRDKCSSGFIGIGSKNGVINPGSLCHERSGTASLQLHRFNDLCRPFRSKHAEAFYHYCRCSIPEGSQRQGIGFADIGSKGIGLKGLGDRSGIFNSIHAITGKDRNNSEPA